jgi:hypothetical protein
MTDKILADGGNLVSSGSSLQKHVTFVDQLNTSIQTSTKSATSALAGVSALSSSASELEHLQGQVSTIIGCLTDALIDENVNLQNAAQAFAATDSNLARMFKSLDTALQPYLGFEQPVTRPPVTKKQPKHHGGKSFWSRVGEFAAGAGLLLSIIPTQVAGGGPEDPLADAASAEEGSAGVGELVSAFK